MPSNRTEAKDKIFRSAKHDTEHVGISKSKDPSQSRFAVRKSETTQDYVENKTLIAGLSDRSFAHKLEKMDTLGEQSKLQTTKLSYNNPYVKG